LEKYKIFIQAAGQREQGIPETCYSPL